MGMEVKLNMKMGHRMVMTPMLQQAIKLLPLARMELIQKVKEELVENPMLEEMVTEESSEEESPEEEDEGFVSAKEEVPKDQQENVADNPEVDWENYIQNNIDKGLSSDGFTERPSIEVTLKSEISFGDHLLWQLAMTSLNDEEKEIGSEIIGNINSAGYLECPVNELAESLNVDQAEVEKTLKLIQTFEPLGVGSRDLQECLLIQARSKAPENELVESLLENHINELEEKFYKKIARKLDVSIPDILEAIKFIKNLNPKPASLYNSGEQSQYIIPDVTVVKKEDGYEVYLNDDGVPLLRVNPYYRRLLKNDRHNNSAKEYMEDKYRSAMWLIKSIEQRRQTILKVAKSIVKFQKEFFDHGMSHLKPLVLRNVAEDIEMHESTISRVTTMKYMHTARGIIDFKFFFHSGIDSDGGVATSSVRIKSLLQELVEKEDSSNPVTDLELVEALMGKDIKIARRTVSKYRKELKIPSANKRRRLYV